MLAESPIPVCVTVKNDIRNIKYCLESIKNQDSTVSLIVHDGGSIDGTLEVVKKYADRILVEQANIAKGRNLLIDFTLNNLDSEFIAFVDSDVILPSNWFSEALQIMKNLDHCGALGCFQAKPVRLYDKAVYYLLDEPNAEVFDESLVKYHNAPCAAVLYRASALRNIFVEHGHFFNEELRAGEDLELSHRMIKSGWSIYLSKHLTVEHRMKFGLGRFWKQQVLYGKGLRDFHQAGVDFDASRRIKQLVLSPLTYASREKSASLFFVMCAYLAIKMLANLSGRYS